MNKISKYILMGSLALSLGSCQDQLDVKNPNLPVVESASTESGVVSLGLGAVYANGFRDLKYFDGVNGRFWAGTIGYHELMGDVIGIEAANQFANQIGCPDAITLDNGTKVLNPSSPSQQIPFLRSVNINANAGANPTYFEWAYMYSMNNSCNVVLDIVDGIKFSGDATVKKNVIKAWCYWWKGLAYARIGSIYYAGLINDKPSVAGSTSSKYVTKEEIIKEANKNLDAAATILGGLTSTADYRAILGGLIPDYCQKGKGGILTPEMWVRNINTLKARNILVNTPVKSMTAAQWASILDLAGKGVTATDLIFTGRSGGAGDNDFMSATGGSVIAKTLSAKAGQGTYKLSERLVQEFKPDDKRFLNNFTLTATWVGDAGRGNAFNTRYAAIDGGKGLPGVIVYGTQAEGGYELALAGNFEENELMKAEALINTGKAEDGLKIIDAVRTSQGAGLKAVAGTNLSLDEAKEEFRRERRVTCAWRGLSFYDARRWGVLENGRTNAVVIDKGAVLNTKATINYNYLDYYDVPDNELAYNKADAASAPTKNPK
jgi:starch-binding outer membrane protein, SusD/RagB family